MRERYREIDPITQTARIKLNKYLIVVIVVRNLEKVSIREI